MTLYLIDNGEYREATNKEIVDAAIRYTAYRVRRGAILTNPRSSSEWLQLTLGHLEYEVFIVIFLDNRNRVIAHEQLFRGTIDGATVHPREVVKTALMHNAAAVIVAHNHPSGVAEPSQADELITRRLKESLAAVDIRILDHLVIGSGICESMAERGMM